MAHLRCDFRSETLDMNTSMTVVLPEGVNLSRVPVVYLFHGLADNCSGWSRYTSVERYARMYNAALIIPEVQRSFYTDMKHGLPYFQFIHDELPRLCRGFFPLSDQPEYNYVMGLSMGGYAALKCAMHTPERYAGCAAFSAAVDLPGRVAGSEGQQRREFAALFGTEQKVPEADDLWALSKTISGERFPRLYLACGEQDALFPQNSKLAAALQDQGVSLCYEHWEGIHGWDFWDEAVRRAFRYMFAGDREE